MQKWEYLTVKINNIGEFFVSFGENGTPDKWADINQLGDDGWELVSSQINYHNGANRLGRHTGIAYFKRPKPGIVFTDDGVPGLFLQIPTPTESVTHDEFEAAVTTVATETRTALGKMASDIVSGIKGY